MRPDPKTDIEQLFERGTEIDAALSRAAREAREAHKQAGLPLPVWRDGETVLIAPEEIETGEPPGSSGSA